MESHGVTSVDGRYRAIGRLRNRDFKRLIDQRFPEIQVNITSELNFTTSA